MVLAFYSMVEMACVSFNKVRLQYYVSKKIKRAEWLNWLLQNPTRLFSTTLIGVNAATVFGSEFAREFFHSVGLDPDYSAIVQVLLVVILGELAPMFAARRYAEHVAMLGVPLIYLSARLLSPLIWVFGLLSKFCSHLVGAKEAQGNIFISQEELEKILEEQGDDKSQKNDEEFNTVTSNILCLRSKDVKQIMEPLADSILAPSTATIAEMRALFLQSKTDFLPIFHREKTNIVGIAYAHDLIRIPENKRIRDYVRLPWLVAETTDIMQILNQFRRNEDEIAVILNEKGEAEGIIHIADIMEEIFGRRSHKKSNSQQVPANLFLERTFPGEMLIGEFNKQFSAVLDPREELTLSELIEEHLGHHGEEGESVMIYPFELVVKEVRMLDIKSVTITTHL